MTATISGTTEFILQNGATESRKAASEIGLSFFNDDLGHVENATHTGQVTGATALALDVTAVTAQPASGVIVGTDTIIINDGGVLSEATMTQVQTFVSGGSVTASGSPLNNEVAVFTTGTDIDSDATFTWDATTLVVNELSFAGDTISNNTTDQPLILRPKRHWFAHFPKWIKRRNS